MIDEFPERIDLGDGRAWVIQNAPVPTYRAGLEGDRGYLRVELFEEDTLNREAALGIDLQLNTGYIETIGVVGKTLRARYTEENGARKHGNTPEIDNRSRDLRKLPKEFQDLLIPVYEGRKPSLETTLETEANCFVRDLGSVRPPVPEVRKEGEWYKVSGFERYGEFATPLHYCIDLPEGERLIVLNFPNGDLEILGVGHDKSTPGQKRVDTLSMDGTGVVRNTTNPFLDRHKETLRALNDERIQEHLDRLYGESRKDADRKETE